MENNRTNSNRPTTTKLKQHSNKQRTEQREKNTASNTTRRTTRTTHSRWRQTRPLSSGEPRPYTPSRFLPSQAPVHSDCSSPSPSLPPLRVVFRSHQLFTSSAPTLCLLLSNSYLVVDDDEQTHYKLTHPLRPGFRHHVVTEPQPFRSPGRRTQRTRLVCFTLCILYKTEK